MSPSESLAASHIAQYRMTGYASSSTIEVAAATATVEELRDVQEATKGDADSGMILTPHLRKALRTAAFYQEPHQQHIHEQHQHTGVHDEHVEEKEHEDVVPPQFHFYQPDPVSRHLGAGGDPDEVAASREGLNGHDGYGQTDSAYSQPSIALSTAPQHHVHGSQSPEPEGPSSAPNTPQQPLSYGDSEDTPATAAEKARQRRENHKEVERRRREGINEGINALITVVPGCEKNKRAILDRAAAYVRELQEQAEHDHHEIAELRAQLDEERRRYEDLRRETDGYASERVRLQRDNVALRKKMSGGLSSLQRVGSALIQNLAPAEAEALSTALAAGLAAGLAEEDATDAVSEDGLQPQEVRHEGAAPARKKARTGA